MPEKEISLLDIHTSVKVMTALNEDHHKQNRKDIDKLFKKLEGVSTISSKVDVNSNQIKLLTVLVLSVIIGGIVFGFWIKSAPARTSNDKSRTISSRKEKNSKTSLQIKERAIDKRIV